MTLYNLIKNFNGPDFPTGGEIIIPNKEKVKIYKTGRGSFIINSKWEKENLKNGLYQIIINEIQYQVNKSRLIEQIMVIGEGEKHPAAFIMPAEDG